jgi:hypothetical protein
VNDDIEAVFTRWKATMGHQRARLDPKRAKAIRGMLMVGYTVEDLELAIFGCSVSSFHQGQNDRCQRYDDIALICRDAEHVDKFIAIAELTMKRSKKYEAPKAEVSAVPAAILAMVKR